MFNFGKKRDIKIGELGEKLAGKYLKKKGYKIIEFNFQNKKGRRLGEIDIIAKTKNKIGGSYKIVFVEVKTRIVKAGENNILPEENITRQKMWKLQKIAQVYIKENGLWDFAYGFDAVTVILDVNRQSAKIKHFKDIFF
ncbi:MAG TPA: YraN family protein [Candidatus Moranbacteria bacterium]|nr:YraN family protein [Candidatus Moranbacteria bacterium]